jgi:hypothetical protein
MKTRRRLFLTDLSSSLLTCALAAFFLLAAPGCVVVPVRMPTKTQDMSGKPLELDFAFLKSGSTTRDQIVKNFAAIDAHLNQNDFFWGRWESSKWRFQAVGLAPDGERQWENYNVLIQFDQTGTVKNWVLVDDKRLNQQLDLFDPVATQVPLDLASPLRVSGRANIWNEDKVTFLILSTESFEYATEASDLVTPRGNIRMIAATPAEGYRSPFTFANKFTNSTSLLATFYFAKPAVSHYGEKGHFARKKLEVRLDPQTFLLLRRYVAQTRREASPARP